MWRQVMKADDFCDITFYTECFHRLAHIAYILLHRNDSSAAYRPTVEDLAIVLRCIISFFMRCDNPSIAV